MNKTILIIVVILIVAIGGYFLFKGGYQSPAPVAPGIQFKTGTPGDVKTKFANTTLSDWPEYQKDLFCIDGSLIGKPELGGMGFHVVKSEVLDDNIIDPLNPEVLLVDANNNIVGVEYMVRSDTQPSLFGAQFEATPSEGHPGFEVTHWDLHLWLIDNPLGTFAAFNPNLTCPEGSLPPTPGATPTPTIKEATIIGTEFAFSPASIVVKAGEKVKLTFQNNGGAPHNLILEELGVGTKTIGSGKTDTVEFTAPASGTYAFFCSVPGHRPAGMEGSLKVE